VAFGAREKIFQLWQSSIRETQRRQAALTKAEINVHVTRERLAQMAAEIAEVCAKEEELFINSVPILIL
jgi:hypothetical protein